ncbi:pyridoxamine 5'-phosphate oxidase family protein [Spiractinospora alimapuensis]|uniref:pyridoxamine 5'-phosphate oxidase family protein n=1 Tax=Spiractinospora alimapuensis TaxID=2820884 RepID=UPI001F4656C2|nr:pyridoxamine 5'-phosphate oxidase family protein [Spiractinospora alimapuensis]QVQ51800.1 pyridoxamine 5'-phosphate oxidase family protein [Spiractinospora alimapuensis]
MHSYHPGERAVQRRATLLDQADLSARAIRAEIPPVAARFLTEQDLLVVGGSDGKERVWCSPLTGPPGFVSVPDDRTVETTRSLPLTDPLATAFQSTLPVGTLAIDPGTRRRMRINGIVEPREEGGLRLHTQQVFANCPKYIQKRTWSTPTDTAAAPTPTWGTQLAPQHQDLLRRTDTFFLATMSAAGADANHRGGNPGFVRVHGPTEVSWPDYVGNAMFTTLGNLQVNPRAGLLVPDLESGGFLQLSGQANVRWGDRPEDRQVVFSVGEVLFVAAGGPHSGETVEYSRFNPPTTRVPTPDGAPR